LYSRERRVCLLPLGALWVSRHSDPQPFPQFWLILIAVQSNAQHSGFLFCVVRTLIATTFANLW
jgi:hypothetical protein